MIPELRRQNLDEAVRKLWLALHELSTKEKEMTEADLDLWGAVSSHPAIQDRLKEDFSNG